MAYRTISVVLAGNNETLVRALRQSGTEVERFTRAHGQAATRVDRTNKQLTTSFDNVGRSLKRGLATAGVLGGITSVGLALRAASNAAIGFDAAMRNVNSITGLSERQLAATSRQVLDLSKTLPQSATELARALYDIASSGFAGAEGLKVLKVAAESAAAGQADTATAARAIAASLNATGQAADQAGAVADTLFQTVKVGVINFSELSREIGYFLGQGQALGITLEEMGSAVAGLTLGGIDAGRVGTSLAAVFTALVKPTDAMQTALRELGFETGQQAIQALGLSGTLFALQRETHGSVGAMNELFSDVQGATAVFTLLNNNATRYKGAIAAIEDPTQRAGAQTAALAEISKSAAFKLDVLRNKLTALAIDAGTVLLPLLTGLGEGLAFIGEHDALRDTVLALAGVTLGLKLLRGARDSEIATLARSIGTRAASTAAIEAEAAALRQLTAAAATAAGAESAEAAAGRGGVAGRAGRVGRTALIAGGPIGIGAFALLEGGNILHGKQEAGRRQRAVELAEQFTGDPKALAKGRTELARLKKEQDAFQDRLGWTQPGGFAEGLDRSRQIEMLTSAIEGAEAATKSEAAAAVAGGAAATTAIDKQTDALKKARAAADEVATAVRSTFLGAVDVIQQFDPEAAAEGVAQARKKVTEAEKRLSDERAQYAASTDHSVSSEQQLASARKGVSDATKELGEAQKEARKIGDLGTIYTASINTGRRFITQTGEALRRGLDPGLITRLLQAGPEQAAPLLDALVSDHSGRLIKLATQSEKTLADISRRAAELARISALAVSSPTAQLTADLGKAQAIVLEKMTQGSRATVESIAKALKIPPAEVARIGAEFGLLLKSVQSVADANPVRLHVIVGKAPQLQFEQGAGGKQYAYARGGHVHGPGSSTSDSIPAWLSAGEFVVNAEAARRNGALLEAINAGRHLAEAARVPVYGSALGLASGGYARRRPVLRAKR